MIELGEEDVLADSAIIRLYGTAPDSIVDGPGLRYAVFVQGCSHGCPGCHNAESQTPDGGTPCSVDALVADIRANGLVHDVTLSGGEPFEQAPAVAQLATRLKALGYGIWTYTGYLYEDLLAVASRAMPASGVALADRAVLAGAAAFADKTASASNAAAAKNVSRETSEEVASERKAFSCGLDPEGVRALLDATDVLVDGPFVKALKSLGLKWRGSSNQRLVDVSASRAAGKVILWETHQEFPQKPASW